MEYLRLLRQGPVRGLWLAETLSVFGDRFFTLALGFLALQRSGATAFGLVAVAESIPHLLIGSFGARLVRWFATFRRLAVLEAAQVAVVGLLPLAWDRVGIVSVFIVIGLIGAADAITGPALAGLVPELVDTEQVTAVTGLMDLSGRLTWVVGPGAAAIALSFVPATALFIADAASFVISAAAFTWLGHLRLSEAAEIEESAPSAEPVARVRELMRRHRPLTWALALDAVGEFCQTALTVGVPVWLVYRLHLGMGSYGVVLSAMGVGSMAGNLLFGNVRLPWRFPSGFCAAWAIRGVLLAAYAFTGDLVQLAAVTAAASVLMPATAILLSAQTAALPMPERLRAGGIGLAGMHVASMSSMLILPTLIADAPARGFAAAGAVTVVAAVVVWAATTGRRPEVLSRAAAH